MRRACDDIRNEQARRHEDPTRSFEAGRGKLAGERLLERRTRRKRIPEYDVASLEVLGLRDNAIGRQAPGADAGQRLLEQGRSP